MFKPGKGLWGCDVVFKEALLRKWTDRSRRGELHGKDIVNIVIVNFCGPHSF
jgi:hypothetical protein